MSVKTAANIVTSNRAALPKIPTSVTVRHLWTPGNEAVAKIMESEMVTETSVHIQKRVQCVLFWWQTPLTECDHRNTSWTCLLYTVHDRVMWPCGIHILFLLVVHLILRFPKSICNRSGSPFSHTQPRESPFLANFLLQILCILLATRIKSLSSETFSFTQHLSTSRQKSYQTKIGVWTPKVPV